MRYEKWNMKNLQNNRDSIIHIIHFIQPSMHFIQPSLNFIPWSDRMKSYYCDCCRLSVKQLSVSVVMQNDSSTISLVCNVSHEQNHYMHKCQCFKMFGVFSYSQWYEISINKRDTVCGQYFFPAHRISFDLLIFCSDRQLEWQLPVHSIGPELRWD